jgi:acetylornithine deacetylase/succinyl-diaminopimelate desuccinylase-like protein
MMGIGEKLPDEVGVIRGLSEVMWLMHIDVQQNGPIRGWSGLGGPWERVIRVGYISKKINSSYNLPISVAGIR